MYFELVVNQNLNMESLPGSSIVEIPYSCCNKWFFSNLSSTVVSEVLYVIEFLPWNAWTYKCWQTVYFFPLIILLWNEVCLLIKNTLVHLSICVHRLMGYVKHSSNSWSMGISSSLTLLAMFAFFKLDFPEEPKWLGCHWAWKPPVTQQI